MFGENFIFFTIILRSMTIDTFFFFFLIFYSYIASRHFFCFAHLIIGTWYRDKGVPKSGRGIFSGKKLLSWNFVHTLFSWRFFIGYTRKKNSEDGYPRYTSRTIFSSSAIHTYLGSVNSIFHIMFKYILTLLWTNISIAEWFNIVTKKLWWI